jgi:hypothetical protein
MNLETIAKELFEQFPGGDRPDLDRREHRLEKFGQFAFGGFVVVVVVAVLGMIYAILDRMVFSGNQPLAGIVLMAFLIFAVLTLTYVVFREDLKEKRRRAGSVAGPPELQTPAVTGRLIEDRAFEPVPAVTENTTDLLPQEKKR